MEFSLLKKIFTKKQSLTNNNDSEVIKALNSLSNNNLLIFHNVTIYHHTLQHTIPIIIFDKLRGLYIFEKKSWSYEKLKNSSIEKNENENNNENNLAFKKTHTIIKKKFNELSNTDGPPIFNFLLMDDLTSNEYEKLNNSLKEFLPKTKIIFKDNSQSEIFKKLQNVAEINPHLDSINAILGNLLIQYTIVDKNNNLHFCTKEQINFINSNLTHITNLKAVAKSGKSTLLLLKSIVEILNRTAQKIIILKHTILAKDILYKQLLNIIEHAIIEIELDKIDILTPQEFIESAKNISADIVMCDDAHLLSNKTLENIQKLQKKNKLLLVNANMDDKTLYLNKNFENQYRKISFYQENQQAKALHIIETLLKNNEAKDIIVVSNQQSREMLKEDLISFIEDNAIILKSSINLVHQDLEHLLLCTYSDINELYTKHIILMDIDTTNENEVEYAFHAAQESVYILYKDNSMKIKNLKEKYENS